LETDGSRHQGEGKRSLVKFSGKRESEIIQVQCLQRKKKEGHLQGVGKGKGEKSLGTLHLTEAYGRGIRKREKRNGDGLILLQERKEKERGKHSFSRSLREGRAVSFLTQYRAKKKKRGRKGKMKRGPFSEEKSGNDVKEDREGKGREGRERPVARRRFWKGEGRGGS